MAKKAQILVNRGEDQEFIAPRTLCRTIASQKAFKQGFPAGKCVISIRNQSDFVYLIMQNKANFTRPKGVEQKYDAGRQRRWMMDDSSLVNHPSPFLPCLSSKPWWEEKNRSEHLTRVSDEKKSLTQRQIIR